MTIFVIMTIVLVFVCSYLAVNNGQLKNELSRRSPTTQSMGLYIDKSVVTSQELADLRMQNVKLIKGIRKALEEGKKYTDCRPYQALQAERAQLYAALGGYKLPEEKQATLEQMINDLDYNEYEIIEAAEEEAASNWKKGVNSVQKVCATETPTAIIATNKRLSKSDANQIRKVFKQRYKGIHCF